MMGEHPRDLKKLFMISDEDVKMRAALSNLGRLINQKLDLGSPVVMLQMDPSSARALAKLLIIDE